MIFRPFCDVRACAPSTTSSTSQVTAVKLVINIGGHDVMIPNFALKTEKQ